MREREFETQTITLLAMIGKELHRTKLAFNACIKNEAPCQGHSEKRGFSRAQYIEAHNSFQVAKSIAFDAREKGLSDHDVQTTILDNLNERLKNAERYQENMDTMVRNPNIKPFPEDVIGEARGMLAMATRLIEKAQNLNIQETHSMNPK